jgi:hypothetical protein
MSDIASRLTTALSDRYRLERELNMPEHLRQAGR